MERSPNKRHRTPQQELKGTYLDYSDPENEPQINNSQILIN